MCNSTPLPESFQEALQQWYRTCKSRGRVPFAHMPKEMQGKILQLAQKIQQLKDKKVKDGTHATATKKV